MLLLAGILLAAETIVFWHHDHGIGPDDHCQICLYAQHHTPATANIAVPVVTLFAEIAIVNPISSETFHFVYRYYNLSRGPPPLFLS